MDNSYILIFIVLILTGCFGLTILPDIFPLLGLIAISIPVMQGMRVKSLFRSGIILLFICLLMSVISCYFNREQGIIATLSTAHSRNFFFILFYFYLVKEDLSIIKIEKVLSVVFLLFCSSYILQYILNPTELFSMLNLNSENRFRMAGQGILSLGLAMNANKYLLYKKKLHLIFVLLGLFVLLLLGFRTMLVAVIISFLFMLYKVYNLNFVFIRKLVVYALAGVFLCVVLYQLAPIRDTVNNMLDRQEEQNFSNEDYIRVVEFNYFTHEHFKNYAEWFFGSGFPKLGSSYGNYMAADASEWNNGSTRTGWVDWGLFGLSWVAGIPTVVCLLLISFRAIFFKIEPSYAYVSAWYVFLLVSSITTIEFYRVGTFVFHAFALYILNEFNQFRNYAQLECE